MKLNLNATQRKRISLSQAGLITTKLLGQDPLPLVVQAVVDGISLPAWTINNQEWINASLLKYGALLFRNFNIKAVAELEQFIQTISGDLLNYSYCSTPRSPVSGNIYTSTEYPADQFIPLHNEMAYASSWPMKIWFFCIQAADHGGETPIADSRKIFQRIDANIKQQFIDKQVMYVRNYGEGLDLEWKNVFQTSSKQEVESYCREANIEFEWKDGNGLKTRQVCQAVATHPQTGEMVWFNQAHLFHISNLKSEVREFLTANFEESDLPRNAYYGDGSPIETSVLNEIREAYQQEAIKFSWENGDILMLDNMLTAHGRMPFLGSRKIVVGMAEPYSFKEFERG